MKTSLIKTKTASLAAMSAIALTAVVMSPAKGQTIVNYNFNTLTSGTSVNGQDGWSSDGDNAYRTPSQVAATPVNAGGGGTLGLTNGLGSVGTQASFANKSFFSAGTLTSTDKIVLTFEAIQVSTPSVALFGLNAENALGFGIWNGTVIVRSNGAYTGAKTASNNDVTVLNNHWYSFKSEWDLSAATATLYMKDLTAGDTGYTQLFFNAAQTQATVSLGAITPSTWNNTWLRVGQSSSSTAGYGTGYLDNLSVVVVPEPHTVALGALGLGMLMFRARRRASLAA